MRAWETFLAEQEKAFGKEVIDRWLRPFKVLKFDAGNLFLEAKDTFQILWFEEHIRPLINDAFTNNNHRKIKVHLSLANRTAKLPTKLKSPSKKRLNENEPSGFNLKFDPIDPLCDFENYIVSENNMITLRMIWELIGMSETKHQLGSINPIYIFGKKGSGKSHLLMAIAKHLQSLSLNVLYAKSETFTSHVVGAIRAGAMSAFREKYRKTDILILDDVHHFSNKGATQEELFHTFNTLHLSGKQIILSGNCPPYELQEIEPRLISRFEWGVTLPLQSMQEDQMKDLLLSKLRAHQFPLSEKVIQFLLQTFRSDPASLMTALEALILRSHLNASHIASSSITVTAASHFLADLIALQEKKALTPEKIIEGVSSFFNITPHEMGERSQRRESSIPRQIAMFLLRQELRLPFQTIGKMIKRDHTTVMTSIKRIEEQIKNNDIETIQSLHAIRTALEAR